MAALLGASAFARAQSEPSFASPLSDLASPRPGRALHEGSWDRKHGNDDALHVKPGQTVTLFRHEGAGAVRRFWVTIAPRESVAVLSQAILRMYWDGDTNPSVECPIGAFFGVGFGEQKDYISMPLDETSGGYNCYWPMPFHRSARWTLTNGADVPIDSFYYNIDFTALDSLPAATRHFHAQFRRENPTTPGRNYTILETAGEGHYVGTALFMAGKALYFLEGNEMVYIDGGTQPAIEGTGTEDYFSSGWYFDRGIYSAPYHGVVIKDDARSRVSAYRWHIEDAIPFTKSIRFTIEHGTGNNVSADYSSVAYYYLAGPSPAPFPLPRDLLPSDHAPDDLLCDPRRGRGRGPRGGREGDVGRRLVPGHGKLGLRRGMVEAGRPVLAGGGARRGPHRPRPGAVGRELPGRGPDGGRTGLGNRPVLGRRQAARRAGGPLFRHVVPEGGRARRRPASGRAQPVRCRSRGKERAVQERHRGN